MSSFNPHERISTLVKNVRHLPYQVRFDRVGRKLDGSSPIDHIHHCSQALLAGALPNAETLYFVATAFFRYVNAKGEISLDEAFKLKSKPKAGNPSRLLAHQQKQSNLLGRMAMIRGRRPQPTIEKAAEEALEQSALSEDQSFEVETLKREYRRRHCKEWEEGWVKFWEIVSKPPPSGK